MQMEEIPSFYDDAQDDQEDQEDGKNEHEELLLDLDDTAREVDEINEELIKADVAQTLKRKSRRK